MKKLTSIATVISLVLAAPGAQASLVFEDYAKVTNVTPQYEKVNLPRKECFSEYVPEREHRHGSLAGPLIGGIAGGILGAQVGRGTGRVAASAAGAAIGAIVGDRMADRGGDERSGCQRGNLARSVYMVSKCPWNHSSKVRKQLEATLPSPVPGFWGDTCFVRFDGS